MSISMIVLSVMIFVAFHSASAWVPAEMVSRKSGNWKKIEGALQFGIADDGPIITANGSYGLIRALHSLPSSKHHGIAYFDLKIVEIPADDGQIQIGISQKFWNLRSLYLFVPAYVLKHGWINGVRIKFEAVHIGCAIKFSEQKVYIWWEGALKETVKLADLKRGNSLDQKFAVKLVGNGTSVQLGSIEMSDDESKFPT